MTNMEALHELWEKEKVGLREIRETQPERLVVPPGAPHMFSMIGIPVPAKQLPEGYLKHSPLDFIVEEIDEKGKVVRTDDSEAPASQPFTPGPDGLVVGADLIKVGIGTNDACQHIANMLNIPVERVAYAGMKDELAVTAQRITVQGVEPERVEGLSDPNLLVRFARAKTKPKRIGNLEGNRFTIFIRTKEPLNRKDIAPQIDRLKKEGFVNYYGVQRFGAPRLLSHLCGAHVMRGDPESAVRTFLTDPSPFEYPLWADIRANMRAHWGDWNAMLSDTQQLPYSLRYERGMLEALARGGEDRFAQAVASLGSVAKLWCMSYASLLANLYLTDTTAARKPLPREIPLLLGQDRSADAFYAPWLKQHGTERWRENVARYSFLSLGKNPTLQTRVRPTIHAWEIVPEGLVISFDLIKGAYATTFLESLFTIVAASPVPTWLKTTKYDTKELLKTGSLAEVRSRFANAIRGAMVMGVAADE